MGGAWRILCKCKNSMNKEKKATRVIRRYPNRRYYDTSTSSHITLEDMRNLVLEGEDIVVVDSKTEEDITMRVLAQIILDYDATKLNVFPKEMLYEMIRFNDRVVSDFFENYFTRVFSAYLDSQKQFESIFKQAQMLNPFFANPSWTGGSGAGSSREGAGGDGANAASHEAAAMREELERLRKELAAAKRKKAPAKPRARKT